MRSKGRISKALALGAVAAIMALSTPTLAGAIIIIGSKFGMVGIVDGQTARLNVVNVSQPPPEGDMPECMVELMFLDSMGNTLAHTRKTLMPGEAAFHDFSFADVVGPQPIGRLQIRPEAMLLGGPDTRGLCLVVPTLEVIDNESMKTMFLLGLTPTLEQGPAPHL